MCYFRILLYNSSLNDDDNKGTISSALVNANDANRKGVRYPKQTMCSKVLSFLLSFGQFSEITDIPLFV